MDHLPLPEGVEHFIQVPYYCPNPEPDYYTPNPGPDAIIGQSHGAYPEKMGWSEDDLRGHVAPSGKDPPFGLENGKPRSPANIERFFQTWLFFGTAIEFLKQGGVHVTTEDFLQPKGPVNARIVTTKLLPSLLLKWDSSAINSDLKASDDPAVNASINAANNKSVLWRTAERILGRTLFYLNLFCQEPKERHPFDQRKEVKWPVRDEISTSIIALVFTLLKAAEQKCDASASSSTENLIIHARSAILYRRLERKWCLSTATQIQDEMDIDGHYYLAASPGLSEDDLDKHLNCTRERCCYEMDVKQYATKHAPSPWHGSNCAPGKWGGQFGGAKEMGKAKDWVDSVCKIIKADAIPIILWSVLQQKFLTVEFHKEGKLRPDFVAISHVWADGKGNPNENSLPMCQLEHIQDMVEKIRYDGRKPAVAAPYSDGIGFWMDTLCIPVADDLKEFRKKAIADMRYVYANAACVLILDEWLMQIPSTSPTPVILTRMYQSNWIKRLWTHQEGFFPKELWVQFSDRAIKMDEFPGKSMEYGTEMRAKGIYLSFPDTSTLRLAQQYGLMKSIYLSMSKDKDKIWMLYKPLSHIMQVRQTSRQADECVCLATILNLDVLRYLGIPDKPDAESAQLRMAMLLGDIHKFDSGIIFNSWERLEIPGFSWAPKSLLGHRCGNWEGRPTVFQSQGKNVGLPVSYPGLASFDFSEATRMSISGASRAFAVKPGEGSGEHPWVGSWPLYVVELSRNNINWNSHSKYAIIMENIPNPGRDEGVVLAVVGLASTGIEEVTSFRHLCLARVRILKDEDTKWIDTVTTDVLSWGTEWLVT